MPNSYKNTTEKEEATLLGEFYRDRLQRENKLDTHENRTSQGMKSKKRERERERERERPTRRVQKEQERVSWMEARSFQDEA